MGFIDNDGRTWECIGIMGISEKMLMIMHWNIKGKKWNLWENVGINNIVYIREVYGVIVQ